MNAKQNGDDYDSDDSDSSSESEDENAELLTPKVDLQILKVRRRIDGWSYDRTFPPLPTPLSGALFVMLFHPMRWSHEHMSIVVHSSLSTHLFTFFILTFYLLDIHVFLKDDPCIEE